MKKTARLPTSDTAKRWIETWRTRPPAGETILAKYGDDLCFVAYSSALDRWVHVANGSEYAINEPPLWWGEIKT